MGGPRRKGIVETEERADLLEGDAPAQHPDDGGGEQTYADEDVAALPPDPRRGGTHQRVGPPGNLEARVHVHELLVLVRKAPLGKADELRVAGDVVGERAGDADEESKEGAADSAILLHESRRIDRVAELPTHDELVHGGDGGRDVAVDGGECDAIASVSGAAHVGEDQQVEDEQTLREGHEVLEGSEPLLRADLSHETAEQPAELVVGDAVLEQLGVQEHRAAGKEDAEVGVELSLFVDDGVDPLVDPDSSLHLLEQLVDLRVVVL